MSNDITEMQRMMIDAVDHNVEVTIVNGYRPCVGKCEEYVQPLDNEPEVAAIIIKTEDYDGLIMLIEDEIESIKLLD